MDRPSATIIHGSAADMACIGSGEAALVITSPPYFPPGMERAFHASRRSQRDPESAWQMLEAFAKTLFPAFREMARVVGKTGLCCIETKDVVFGEFRLPLAAQHAALARQAGLWVRSSLQFRSTGIKPSHLPGFVRKPAPGTFRTLDASTLLLCSAPSWRPRKIDAAVVGRQEALELVAPYWRLTPARSGRIHEHQTPPELVRRLVSLLTVPNDLVADPFAGSGQVLRIARDLGRRSLGYERDQRRYERAAAALLGIRSRGFRAADRKVSG